jgi:hypothetical protein
MQSNLPFTFKGYLKLGIRKWILLAPSEGSLVCTVKPVLNGPFIKRKYFQVL